MFAATRVLFKLEVGLFVRPDDAPCASGKEIGLNDQESGGRMSFIGSFNQEGSVRGTGGLPRGTLVRRDDCEGAPTLPPGR